jgi:hypothetical protein
MATGVVTVDRAIELRALRRGDLVTVMRWQSRGVGISGHRNETLALRVALDRRAAVFAALDRENEAGA